MNFYRHHWNTPVYASKGWGQLSKVPRKGRVYRPTQKQTHEQKIQHNNKSIFPANNHPHRWPSYLQTKIHRTLVYSCNQVVELVAFFNEFILHEVINVQQAVGVLPGIVNELWSEWPDPPVSPLEHLVGLYLTEVEEEGSQGAAGVLQHHRRLVSVKQVHQIHPTVTLQPQDVLVCPVDYLWECFTLRPCLCILL